MNVCNKKNVYRVKTIFEELCFITELWNRKNKEKQLDHLLIL
jgi:hypothetical protein